MDTIDAVIASRLRHIHYLHQLVPRATLAFDLSRHQRADEPFIFGRVLDSVPQVSDIAFMSSILLNTRELSKDTAKVLRNLPKSGPRVITRGSEPVGILIPPSPGGIEADIELLGRLRLGQALAATQREAVLSDTATLSMSDIDAEIHSARSTRRIKANANTSLGH